MSRVANKPVSIPSEVEVRLSAHEIYAKGPRGENTLPVHIAVQFAQSDNEIRFSTTQQQELPKVGTMRMLAHNLIVGVSQGFEKKLLLVGVGYRAQKKGKTLNLQLGFSHPVDYSVPDGVNVETPSQTEVVVSGIDKQKVGQVAAEIRAFRPPEPYKGKGVRYANEHILIKEGKKK